MLLFFFFFFRAFDAFLAFRADIVMIAVIARIRCRHAAATCRYAGAVYVRYIRRFRRCCH